MRHPASSLIEPYGVGFTRVGDGPWQLQGSGTLVTDGYSHAILTSTRVAGVLSSTGRVGLALRPDLNQIAIARSDLTVLPQTVSKNDGTPIVVVTLAPIAAGQIGAVKQFFDLRSLNVSAHRSCYVHGFINELVVTHLPLDCFDLIYNFDTATIPARLSDEGETEGMLQLHGVGTDEHQIPADVSGLTGGGVWRLCATEAGDRLEASLVGVIHDPLAGAFSQLAPNQVFRI